MQNLAYLLLGIRDSLSPDWLRNILFFTHPQTKELHPESKKLFGSVYRTIVQVILIYILLPKIFEYLSFYSTIIKIVYYYSMTLVTILTYGYTFFYFGDVYDAATNIAKWNRKVNKELGKTFPYGELQENERVGIFRGASNKIKSFIFLACYGAFYTLCSAVLIHIPYIGRINLVFSEAFFNGIFYFIRKWPYDDFNIGFFERKWAYLTGYGLAVSIICNLLFKDFPLLSNGAYFLISPWMIINMIVSSPPNFPTTVTTFSDLVTCISTGRDKQTNSYNTHRNNLRNPQYQTQVVKEVVVLKPILLATRYVQSKLETLQQH